MCSSHPIFSLSMWLWLTELLQSTLSYYCSEWSLCSSSGTGWHDSHVMSKSLIEGFLVFDDFRLMSWIRYCLLFCTTHSSIFNVSWYDKVWSCRGNKSLLVSVVPFELCMSLCVFVCLCVCVWHSLWCQDTDMFTYLSLQWESRLTWGHIKPLFQLRLGFRVTVMIKLMVGMIL